MKKLLKVLLFASLLLLVAACGTDDNDNDATGDNGANDNETEQTDPNDNGTDENDSDEQGRIAELQESGVTIGFSNEAPYAYEEDGELRGAAVDIAIAVFNELGIDNVDGQLSEWGQLIPGLQAGHFDAITAGMAITADRSENVNFGEPEMQYGEGLVVEAGNPHDIHSFEDIANNPDITVVVMQGATAHDFLLESGVSEDQIETAPDVPATFSAVQAGRADATTGTEMTVRMAFDSADTDDLEIVETFEQPDIHGVPSYGAAAFRLDDTELLDAYNEALQTLLEDGTVEELLEANGFSAQTNFVPAGEITTEEIIEADRAAEE